jgi:ribonuclease III
VTGQGPRESNERLEFLGDSVLGLVTSEYLYRQNPDEHEGQLTKTKSLLVSKAILSRRALAMGLGRFVLMSHSEVESGGRQRLSILADAFEAVLGAIYLDQGFEAARAFIHRWLLKDSQEIASDKRHANWKSHLQEYVQSTFHTHPVYRVRSEMGPDHSKVFMVDVLVGKRLLGSGKGRNKKDAEQAAARNALDQAGAGPADAADSGVSRDPEDARAERDARGAAHDTFEEGGSALLPDSIDEDDEAGPRRRRGRRGGRGQRSRELRGAPASAPDEGEARGRSSAPESERESGRELSRDSSRHTGRDSGARAPQAEAPAARRAADPAESSRPPRRSWLPPDEENEEIGRPEGPLEERHVDVYDWEAPPSTSVSASEEARREPSPGRRVDSGRTREVEHSRHAEHDAAREVERDAARDAAHDAAREARQESAREAERNPDPEHEMSRERESGDFEPRAGTLFSHERTQPEAERKRPEAPEAPAQYGRRSARSRPGSRR